MRCLRLLSGCRQPEDSGVWVFGDPLFFGGRGLLLVFCHGSDSQLRSVLVQGLGIDMTKEEMSLF